MVQRYYLFPEIVPLPDNLIDELSRPQQNLRGNDLVLYII